MKRFFGYVIALLMVFAASANAQNKELKHKGGDFYMGVGVGFSQSLAENAVKTDFIRHQIPSANVLIGYNFNPYVGVRLTGAFNNQMSHASKAAEKALPDIFGRYGWKTVTGTLSGVINLTNIIFGYENEREVTWSFLMGGGYLSSFGFDKKLDKWNEYPYYPVDAKGGGYATGHVGLMLAVEASKHWDIDMELRGNATDNKYNGVYNGNHLDFYVDLMVNFVYHFSNKQGLTRLDVPERKAFVDPVVRDHSGDYLETVRYGETMYTVIPFYAGFSYLNDVSTKRIGVVADFLKKNPNVRLKVVGHPDVYYDADPEYNATLAEKRAKVVYETLVHKYKVDESRLEMGIDETVIQNFKTLREWIPAVNFEMMQ